MGTLRGILHFQNEDSTQDFNRRLFGVVGKGVYNGDAQSHQTAIDFVLPVPTQLQVQINPFVAMGADGMVVLHEGTPTILPVQASTDQYVVCRAKYSPSSAPLIQLQVITAAQYAVDPDRTQLYLGQTVDFLIVLARINLGVATEVLTTQIDQRESHVVNTVGRLFIRGSVPLLINLPSNPLVGPATGVDRKNVTGDMYLVVALNQFYLWTGSAWVAATDGALAIAFNNHITGVAPQGDPAHAASFITQTRVFVPGAPRVQDAINAVVAKAGDTMTGPLTLAGLTTGTSAIVATGKAGTAGSGINATGGSSGGSGVNAQGGAFSGVGVNATGGSSDGLGIIGHGGATNGTAILGLGTGTGTGVNGVGGATSGSGVTGTGGAVSGTGVTGTGGAPNGQGVVGNGTGANAGVFGQGGSTSGLGVHGQGGTPAGDGVVGQGFGAASAPAVDNRGVIGIGGTGDGTGVEGRGGVTNGIGVVGIGAGTGAGVSGSSAVSTNGNGVVGLGHGTGLGVFGTGGAGVANGDTGGIGTRGNGGDSSIAGGGTNTGGIGVRGTGGTASGGGTNVGGIGVHGSGGISDGIGVLGTSTGTGTAGKFDSSGGTGAAVEAIGRILGFKPVAAVASANDMTLTAGNFFIISGNVTINRIATAGWSGGSIVVLNFSGTPVVKYNGAATGGGFARLILAGAADFSPTAVSTLTLVYNGTDWLEVARMVF